MIIGLTGNIGSGKSLASKILASFGAAVIDADRVGHQVLQPDGAAYQTVLDAFGPRFLAEDGSIRRRELGAYVFAEGNEVALQRLNQLTHPAICEEIRRLLAAYRNEGKRFIVIEAAILFDSAILALTEENWLIVAPRELLLARVAARDHCGRAAAERRLASQRTLEDLEKLADRVFVNDGDPKHLEEQLKKAYQELERAE